MERPKILLIPGLSDNVQTMKKTSEGLEQAGFEIRVMSGNWRSKEESLAQKIRRVRKELRFRDIKAVIGVSAGASLVFSAAADLAEIEAMVNVSGRLRRGENVYPTLEQAASQSSAFYDAVVHVEAQILPYLTAQRREHIMTMRGTHDRLVPPSTTNLDGATNIQYPALVFNPFNHLTNIRQGLRSQELVDFLKTKLR